MCPKTGKSWKTPKIPYFSRLRRFSILHSVFACTKTFTPSHKRCFWPPGMLIAFKPNKHLGLSLDRGQGSYPLVLSLLLIKISSVQGADPLARWATQDHVPWLRERIDHLQTKLTRKSAAESSSSYHHADARSRFRGTSNESSRLEEYQHNHVLFPWRNRMIILSFSLLDGIQGNLRSSDSSESLKSCREIRSNLWWVILIRSSKYSRNVTVQIL